MGPFYHCSLAAAFSVFPNFTPVLIISPILFISAATCSLTLAGGGGSLGTHFIGMAAFLYLQVWVRERTF